VRIRDDFPAGHIRTPVYLRGKTGIVDRFHGEFINAETAAYGLPGPRKARYKVSFRSDEIWSDYAGPKSDVVEADLYEHWLEKIA
jgi:nitrile hydratase